MESYHSSAANSPFHKLTLAVTSRILAYAVVGYPDLERLRLVLNIPHDGGVAVSSSGGYLRVKPCDDVPISSRMERGFYEYARHHCSFILALCLGPGELDQHNPRFEVGDQLHIVTSQRLVYDIERQILYPRTEEDETGELIDSFEKGVFLGLFEGCKILSIRFLGEPTTDEENGTPPQARDIGTFDESEMLEVAKLLDTAVLVSQVQSLSHRAAPFFDPIAEKLKDMKAPPANGDWRFSVVKKAMIRLEANQDSRCWVAQEGNLVVLRTQKMSKGSATECSKIQPFYGDTLVCGVMDDDGIITLYTSICIDDSLCCDNLLQHSMMELDELVHKSFQQTDVEGVAIVDGFLSEDQRVRLNNKIDSFVKDQVASGRFDYEPHSKNVVRNICHPALFPYVKGSTTVSADPVPEAAKLPKLMDVSSHYYEVEEEEEEQVGPFDFWGRLYQESVYQWLPTYFSIAESGACTIDGYINNLGPRQQHRDLYRQLEDLFTKALPHVEAVYSYVHAVQPHFILRGEVGSRGTFGHCGLQLDRISFRGQKLQVITKIVEYELGSGQSYEGTWHVEGISQEEIVLTCLFISKRSGEIKGGDVLFQRAFLRPEARPLNEGQSRHIAFDEFVKKGCIPWVALKRMRVD